MYHDLASYEYNSKIHLEKVLFQSNNSLESGTKLSGIYLSKVLNPSETSTLSKCTKSTELLSDKYKKSLSILLDILS